MQEIHSSVADRVCKPGAGSQSGETAKAASQMNWNIQNANSKTYTPLLHFYHTNISFTLKHGQSSQPEPRKPSGRMKNIQVHNTNNHTNVNLVPRLVQLLQSDGC